MSSWGDANLSGHVLTVSKPSDGAFWTNREIACGFQGQKRAERASLLLPITSVRTTLCTSSKTPKLT